MKQLYVCDICHGGFDNKEDCEKCEASHIEPDHIEAAMFMPFNVAKTPYVDNILIRMKDDTLVRYVFDEVLEDEPQINPRPEKFQEDEKRVAVQ